MLNKVVTRFAPSPTGFMHIGGVRTALYAYLWARKNKGVFILRIEDTDKEREVAGSTEHIIESLRWLGINWDEGPDVPPGPHAPYRQSERLALYQKYALNLLDRGLAYPDPYTEEEVEGFRQKAKLEKKPFLYRGHRPAFAEASMGKPENFIKWNGARPLRFKTPEIKSYKWHDLVYGELSAGEEALDDFILIKSDGYPTYNFAHIVDDIEMGVTHVMRGQEFISSTPKFLSVYEALKIKPPFFATLPPILAPDGKKKLGKRDGAKDILEYKSEGYLPAALANFLAFLGWNPGDDREIFTMDELVEAFDISKIGHSGARANFEKLDWINREHIRKLSASDLRDSIWEYLPNQLKIEKIVPIIAERIYKWKDVRDMVERGDIDFFYKKPEIKKEKLIYKNTPLERTSENLLKAVEALEKLEAENFTAENVRDALLKAADKLESRGELLHPVRYALSGLDSSPDPFVIAEVIGKSETLSRLRRITGD